MRSWLIRVLPALALAVLALALRCYGLTAPLLDYHSWRQADTAAIARNYAGSGYRLLYPQVDWGGLTPGYVESEFPLYTYSLALLYSLFGVHEWLGRLLTALCGAAAVAALYELVRLFAGRRAACYAALVLALMPFPLYFGRAVMPDTVMLLVAILAIWTFQRWLASPSAGRLALALLCGALAPLAKTPNLVIVAVPLAAMVVAARPARRMWVSLALYAICFALPALLWTRHAQSLPLEPQFSFGIGEKLFDLRLLVDPQFYLLLARWSVEHVLTLAGLPFFILAFGFAIYDWRSSRDQAKIQNPQSNISSSCGARRTLRNENVGELFLRGSPLKLPYFHISRPMRLGRTHSDENVGGAFLEGRLSSNSPFFHARLPYAWLLGVLLFLLIGAAGVVGQDYYILPLAGPAAWLIGVGLDRAQRFVEHREPRTTQRVPDREPRTENRGRLRSHLQVSWLIPIVGLGALAGLSFAHIAPLYDTRTTEFYRTLGRRLDLALPAGAQVGLVAPAVSEILYYGERKGWRLDPIVVSVQGGLASLAPDLGVRYVLVADPWLTEQRGLLTGALREYRRIPVGPYALLLDLARPGEQQPFELAWETGHLVAEPFLSAWKASGGAAGLGYPLSDALDGPEGREQYFERGLLVRNDAGVTRAPAGQLLLAAQGRAPQNAEVAPEFRALWLQVGGEQTLGPALTPLLDADDGWRIQYFDYGLLELPPGGAPQIGASGRRLLDARGLNEERQIVLARDT